MTYDDTAPIALQPAAGWYPDPWFRGHRRYWDGKGWTAHSFPEEPAPTANAAGLEAAAPGTAPPPTTGVPGGGPPPPEWWSPGPDQPETPIGTQAPPPPPSRPGFWPPRGRNLVIALIILGFILGLIGGAVLPGHRNTAAPNALPPAPTPSASPTPTDPAASALFGLVLHQADVTSTETVVPIPGGTTVAGGATLDLCNGTYPSESQRTARLQVAGFDVQATALLSTEAVLYAKPNGATQAFSELTATATSCPSTPVVSPVGEPTVATQFNPAPDGSWPAVASVDRLAFDFSTTDSTGNTDHNVAVYLKRGRVLLGIYFTQPDGAQQPVQGQTTIPGIVNIFAQRLAALPASIVDGG